MPDRREGRVLEARSELLDARRERLAELVGGGEEHARAAGAQQALAQRLHAGERLGRGKREIIADRAREVREVGLERGVRNLDEGEIEIPQRLVGDRALRGRERLVAGRLAAHEHGLQLRALEPLARLGELREEALERLGVARRRVLQHPAKPERVVRAGEERVRGEVRGVALHPVRVRRIVHPILLGPLDRIA
jgi:hypothetical protein